MSTLIKGLTVDQYDRLVARGILPQTNRFELILGRIVEKEVKGPKHCAAAGLTEQALQRRLPPGWHLRIEKPLRLPNRKSEPEPDVAVARGSPRDYLECHPGPGDVALVVEVTRSSVAKDRRLARVYGPGGIPVCWIVNLPRRQLEVYVHATAGAYPAPRTLPETAAVELVLGGQVVAQIAVAELLP